MARVRLTKKLAQEIDGIDLTGHAVGDVLELTVREAGLLVAEGWAEPEKSAARERPEREHSTSFVSAVAADSARKRRHRRAPPRKS